MNILLTGGAGYIGSHVVRALETSGHECVVFDNLCKGHAQALGTGATAGAVSRRAGQGAGETPATQPATRLIVGDVTDSVALAAAMRAHRIEAVIHLAAFIEAGESVQKPEKYFRNNTVGGLALLEAMQQAGVGRMVFSSTAAVYGTPARVPIQEDDPTLPINPYGASKLCVELMMRGFAQAYGMGFVALRYFNVAGAHPAGDIGEDHNPETHLVPLVLQVPLGKRPAIKIFGDDYDTPDGTCIRDYIHVMDLAQAHVLALSAIEPGQMKVYNLGNGAGFSVREIIETCRAITGHAIPAELAPRRSGDPARLVADSARAQRELGWRPQYADIATVVRHAWEWHRRYPGGY